MQELEAPLECRTVALPRELGSDEREDHVAELIVQLTRFRGGEPRPAK
jgi:hypothetical protein